MFGLFGKKTKENKLRKQYQKLTSDAFRLSKTNRMKADQLYAEAEELMKQIESLADTQKP